MRLHAGLMFATYRVDFPSFSEGLSLRRQLDSQAVEVHERFPFLFGRAFIEAMRAVHRRRRWTENFPSFSEGLSLRPSSGGIESQHEVDFPSFSEGLSLRRPGGI